MNIEKDFEELYEGWKKGKYTIKDKNGKILGTYSSGGKAQKAMDDLMQKGDYDKLEVSIVEEKDWHDGHEPQGGHDHYDEEEDLDEKFEKEASTYRDKQKKSKEKKQFGISRKKGNVRHGGSGYGEDIEEDLNLIAVSEDMCDLKRGELSSDPMKAAWDKKCGSGNKKKKPQTALQKVSDKVGAGKMYNDFDPFIEEALGEGYKDLPPHLQKLIKKIEKKQKDWNKQNPNAKIKTLVYNPETGKPDIEVKENTMKLEDTVKQVLEGKKKKGEDPLTSKEPMKAYEDNTNDKSDDGDGLDKVQPKAVKKKFKDRKDKDIDNDGDVDDSDKFLHKRRKAVSKAINKEEKIHSKFFTAIKNLMKNK